MYYLEKIKFDWELCHYLTRESNSTYNRSKYYNGEK